MRPLQFPRTRVQTLPFLWTARLLPLFPCDFLSRQPVGTWGASILPAMRSNNSNPPARSGGESGELLEACTQKHHGDAGGILPSSPQQILCVLTPARGSLCSHLPDTCILLITMFRCCSSHLLKHEQEMAGVVPWLQLGRAAARRTHCLCSKKKKRWKFCLVSPTRSGKLLGCSGVVACAISAKNLGIWGLTAKIKP